MSAVPAVATVIPRQSLVAKMAAKYHVEPEKMLVTLKATAFKVKDGEATNEQMMALLVVADQYNLNPWTKEIFAFPDKQNGIVPVVGVDGWSRIINDHPQSDGLEFRQAETIVTLPDAQPCPEWMEVVIHRKDRSHPVVVREYLDEVYRPLGTYKDGNKMKPGPWQTHTKRFLRHKCLIQGARIAYGFGGIYDEDEAERIIERDITPHVERPAIEMPKAKSLSVTDAVRAGAKGEVITTPAESTAPAAPSEPSPPLGEEAGAAPVDPKKSVGTLKPSQVNIIRAKLKSAALTEVDLDAAFPGLSLEPKDGCAQFAFEDFADITAWIASRAAA